MNISSLTTNQVAEILGLELANPSNAIARYVRQGRLVNVNANGKVYRVTPESVYQLRDEMAEEKKRKAEKELARIERRAQRVREAESKRAAEKAQQDARDVVLMSEDVSPILKSIDASLKALLDIAKAYI